jgi:hypothetical protein
MSVPSVLIFDMRRTLAFHLRRFLCLTLFLVLSFSSSSICCAASGAVLSSEQPGEPDTTELVQLTRDALAKEIQLERQYLQYTIAAQQGPEWRWLRYPLLSDVASGCGLAKGITLIAERGKNLDSPGKLSKRVIGGARITALTGNIIGASASGIELGANGLLALKNKMHHCDPSTGKRCFMQNLRELDDALNRLQTRLAQSGNSQSVQLLASECRLLKAFRDWDVHEFAQYYADIKSRQSSNSVFYALNIASNVAESAAYLLALKGFHRSHWYKPSSVCSILDDSIGFFSGPTRVAVKRLLFNAYFDKFSRAVNERIYDRDLEVYAQMESFKQQVASASKETRELAGPIDKRLEAYTFWNDRDDELVRKVLSHLRHVRSITEQNLLAGPLTSSASLASDFLGAITAYKDFGNPKTTNNIAFAGAISSCAASGVSVYLTTHYLFEDIRYTAKLKRAHSLPDDILMDRLKVLDEVQKLVGLPGALQQPSGSR